MIRKDKVKWIVAILFFLIMFTSYLGRLNISFALPFISKEYSWTEFQKGNLGGILLGVFLISYGFSNVFLSSLVGVVGSKKLLIISTLTWTVSTVFGAIFGHNYNLLLISRFFLGLGQGIFYPIIGEKIQSLFAPIERSRANAFVIAGGNFANIFGPFILIPFITISSWRVMFYSVALSGIILILPIWLYLEDLTSYSPLIQDIRGETGEIILFSRFKNGLKKIIKRQKYWTLIVSQACFCMAAWGISSWLPTYLAEIHKFKFNLKEMASGLTISHMVGMIGLFVGSWMGDKIGRRIIIIIAFLTSGLFTLTILLVHSRAEVILCLSLMMFFRGMIAPNNMALLQSIVPSEIIGIATGLLNGIGFACGALGPVIFGMSIAFSGFYKLGFILTAIISFLGGSLFVIFYKEKEQNIKIY